VWGTLQTEDGAGQERREGERGKEEGIDEIRGRKKEGGREYCSRAHHAHLQWGLIHAHSACDNVFYFPPDGQQGVAESV
jgi:hypothetical protein